MLVLSYIKKKIQDNINGYYYSIISNIIRSTIFPYKAKKKNILVLMKIIFTLKLQLIQ